MKAVMLTLNYLTMVAEHIFAVNINHFWKDCKTKRNTLLTEFTKQSAQLSPEGWIACLFK